MLSYEEIMNYCSNYRIENGVVIDKKTNAKVLDEETILRVKSAVLIFRESKDSYQNDIKQFGKTNRSQENYIRKTMEKFSTNNEENNFGTNKLVRAILKSNGHYEEFLSGSDLVNSKFSILVEPKKEYGLAFLRLKFREKGLDIESLNVSQDFTELQHNGFTNVIIDFKVKKYEKSSQKVNSQSSSNLYQHPRAKDLNELERLKQIAIRDNDEDGFNYAQRNIERIIRENPATISEEEFNAMSLEEQISFIQVKINEARVLKDKNAFDFWNNKLKDLKSKKNIVNGETRTDNNQKDNVAGEKKSKDEKRVPNENNQKQDVEQTSTITFIDNIRDYEIAEILNLYIQMILSGKIDELELNNLIKRMEIVRDVLNATADLAKTEEEKKYYEDTIKMVNSELQKMINSKSKSNQSDFMAQINNLKQETNKLHEEYKQMFSDGYIDDEELDALIIRMRNLSKKTMSIQFMASNDKERHILYEVMDEIDRELQKMITFKNKLEDSVRSFK